MNTEKGVGDPLVTDLQQQVGSPAPSKTFHRAVSFYHRETGLFSGNHLVASDDNAVMLNTPPDHIAIDGHHDHLSKKADITTGEVVDYQPPQPSVVHEWDSDSRRWVMSAAARQRQETRTAALWRIAEIERDVQPGLLRAMALGQEGAKERLHALDAEIAGLMKLIARAELRVSP